MFDWKEFQNVAKNLIKTNDEAYLRSALSRSYYSFFEYCRYQIVKNNLATQDQIKELSSRKSDVHKKLFNIFKYNNYNSNDKSNFIANHLNNGRNMRNKADYDAKYNSYYLEKDVQKILANTDKTFKYIQELELKNN